MEEWGAIEEVLLLDAVEQDGFGNWEDIAAHVVTKTARGKGVWGCDWSEYDYKCADKAW